MKNAANQVRVSADLADLVPRYLDNRRADLTFARQLLDSQDYYMLAGMAHRIQGSAASYGFNGLGDIAFALCAAAEARDGSAVEHGLHELERFLHSVEISYV